ncbi:MAG: CAP domain-containing protein, partial [Candidatus Fermentibacteraceae bacterium]|nr:CAP domain-containing protein [Candidatus Fermentibacteraceae bacterium]
WDTEGLSTGNDVDYFSDLEKDVLLHLNMARTDPARYAEEYIEPRLQYFSGMLYREPGKPILITAEGVDALEDCISDMKDMDSMQPLYPSEGIAMAALDHALDLSRTGETGHTGSDGSQFSLRIERYGEWRNTIGEVISYGPLTGREIVLGLLIDDGVPDDSHRRNVLNPAFTLAGIAVEDHSAFGNVCVIDFAGDYTYAGYE